MNKYNVNEKTVILVPGAKRLDAMAMYSSYTQTIPGKTCCGDNFL